MRYMTPVMSPDEARSLNSGLYGAAITGVRGEDAYLRDQVLSRFVLRPAMIELVRALRRKGVITTILSDQTDWLDKLDAQGSVLRENSTKSITAST